jgi:hypothetical protein
MARCNAHNREEPCKYCAGEPPPLAVNRKVLAIEQRLKKIEAKMKPPQPSWRRDADS